MTADGRRAHLDSKRTGEIVAGMVYLENGTIIDGSGQASYTGSVVVRDGLIESVTDAARSSGIHRSESSQQLETVDCSGLVIAPGFIDVHSHADLEVLEHRPEKVLQGVTSEVVGNCGFSLFPRIPTSDLVPTFELFSRRGDREWDDASAYFGNLEQSGTRTNVAALTGHSTLRVGVSGTRDGRLDPAEQGEMEKRLAVSLEQGSIGLSTGLNEVPSSYSDFDELMALCRVVRRYDAHYTSHLRDYKFRFVEAVREALDLARQTQVPVQLSHLQAVGRKNWDKMDPVLELIDEAHREGVDVGIDAYPYIAGSCNLTQVLPIWSLEGGTDRLLERLTDPDTRRQIADEANMNMANGWDDILLSDLPNSDQHSLIGTTVQQVAALRGSSDIETALDLLIENRGVVMIISFNQSEENLRKVLTHPLTSIITDGVYTDGRPHPRTFGTYPTFLGEFVRDKGWMSIEDAVRKVSAQPAERFRLEKRGRVNPGFFADLVLFSADTIGTKSDYTEPRHSPEGIHHVLVNGAWAVRDGELHQNPSGSPLRA